MRFVHSKLKLLHRLLVVLTCTATTPSFALTFERVVEPPPAIYAQGPTLTGRTYEIRLDSVEAVDQVCRTLLHGLPQGAYKGAYYMGCYNPRLDAVILMQPKAWPSRREWEAIRAHEWAHARGWRHRRDGTGTDWLASLPPRGGVRSASATAAASRPQG
jgi:hypothetical protein